MSPPPPANTFRERLFRPYRWRLWAQFLALGAFVLLVPLFFSSQRVLDSGREVLVEHETIDLSDEANLRVNEFREDMSYLASDLRGTVARFKDKEATAAEVVDAVFAEVRMTAPPTGEPPQRVRDARRRMLHEAVVGVYALAPAGDGVKPKAWSSPLPDHDGRQQVLLTALTDAYRRRTRKEAQAGRSGLHFQPPDPADPGGHGRAVLAFAEPGPDAATYYALVIDFSRYVRNRQRVSPRHLYVVTDPGGRVLVHPDPAVADARPLLSEHAAWNYPQFAARSWFDTTLPPNSPGKADGKQARMAAAVRSGGARLDAAAVPGLACFYVKGYFGDRRDLGKQLGDRCQAAVQALNDRLTAALDADPLLRVGEAIERAGYVELSHPNRDTLKPIQEDIDKWWREQTGTGSGGADWGRVVPCPTMQGQLTPLRVDLNDVDDPPWLVVAASPNELKQDIDDRFNDIFWRWVAPTAAVAGVFGLVIVWVLTRALHKLAESAAALDPDKEPNLPLGGPYEVSQLARTLQGLASQVLERDRQLRDRAARYETILRAAGEGVLVTDSAGVIEEANKAAGRMFGCKPEELLGKPVTSLVLQPDQIPAARDSDTVTAMLPGSRTLDTVQGRKADGSNFWLEMNLKPVPLRDRVVVVCVLRDVTQRRANEESIRRLNDDLEVRVRQRTAELEETNTKLEVALRQAEAAVRAKDTFVATMSHELRQPLHIIIGFTEALKEEAGDLGVASIEPDLNKILSAARHLLDLINDILDMAKISAGKMELSVSTFPLAELVGEVKTLVGPLAAKNGNTFNVDAPDDLGDMAADARRVRQVLINLLSNAFKFTSGGRVDLRVRRVTEQDREWVRFSVADTGRGMTPEQVARLFQRFYQADSSTTRGAGGTGLGLAISQSFNELMGGQPIRVTSQPGYGSEFVVTLPAAMDPPDKPSSGLNQLPPTPLPTPIETPVVHSAEGRTVLVVDDDPMVRELMERFLLKDGFRVLLAANGDDGFRLAKDERPSLITLDVTMPGADGWGVLGRLKGDPATADIPVIMLTIVDDRGRGFALGATEYLTKPIDWNRLGLILRRYLSGRSDEVLVIDDDPNNRQVVRRHLERDGWTVTEAADGEQGLSAFERHRPGLILLDLMMPVLDGFGFLDRLGKQHPGHRVPVVVLTAKELNAADFDKLNGRVARILEKGDLNHLDALLELIRRAAKR